MKHFLIIVIAFFIVSYNTADAQITISNNNMPSNGDTFRFSTSLNLTLANSLLNTGANYNWDASSLNFLNQNVEEYKSSSATPYIINFGFNAIGLKVADTLSLSGIEITDVYNFYRNSTSSFSNVGLGFKQSMIPIPLSAKHSDPDEVYFFPLNFGNRDSSTYFINVPIGSPFLKLGDYFSYGYRITEVDGWGKITTPYASNVNCLRLKSTRIGRDSVKVSVSGTNIDQGLPVNLTTYQWLSDTEKVPILEISGREVFGVFTPTNIRYRDIYRKRNNQGPDIPEAAFISNKVNIKEDEKVEFTNLSTGQIDDYLWLISPSQGVTFEDNTTINSENPVVAFANEGVYTVQLTVSNSSGDDVAEKNNYITVTSKSSVDISNLNKPIGVYYSKENKAIHFTRSCNFKKAEIFNLSGQKLSEFKPNNCNKQSLNISHLSNGLYIIKFDNLEPQKIVIY